MKRTRKSDAGEKVFMAINLTSGLSNFPTIAQFSFGHRINSFLSSCVFVLQKDTKPPVQINGKDTNTDQQTNTGELSSFLKRSNNSLYYP